MCVEAVEREADAGEEARAGVAGAGVFVSVQGHGGIGDWGGLGFGDLGMESGDLISSFERKGGRETEMSLGFCLLFAARVSSNQERGDHDHGPNAENYSWA